MKVTESELESIRTKLKSLAIDPATATGGQIEAAAHCTNRRARTYQEYLRGKKQCDIKTSGSDEHHEVIGNTWQITLPKTPIHTLDELLEYAKVDTSVWVVEKFVVNKWEMGSVDDKGKPQTTPLFQVKAWLRRKEDVAAIKSEIASLKEEAKKAAKVYAPVTRRKSTSGYMLEISIPDLHMGKMAWAKETGYGNYDLKIAEQCFEDALESLLERTCSYAFDQVVLVVGNDLLHTDNRQGTTEAGTPVDTDGRYHKAFYKTRLMITRAIERLRKVAPVVVKIVSGNHDYLSAWHLGDSLECTFAKCQDVQIDNSPTSRKYHQFGQVMLMFTHGHKGKLQDYPLVMATEKPEMFGSSKFREAHTGDKHTTRTQEFHGVKVRISPALCDADAWHSENMFVGNSRSAEAFVWSSQEGLVGTAHYTVPQGN